jgi:hypothetical protein
MQDEIVARLGRALDVELTAAEARRAEGAQSADPDTLDLTFRGWAAFNRGVSRDNLTNAERCFEQALTLDPSNVEALAGLAEVKCTLAQTHLTDTQASYLAGAEEAAAKAVRRSCQGT